MITYKTKEIKKIKESEMNQDSLYQEMPQYDEIIKLSWFEKRRLRKLKKKHPDNYILIRMEMNSGHFIEFYTIENNNNFIFRKKQYVIDISLKYYIKNRNVWAYDYHESLSIPLRNKVKLSEDINELLNRVEDKSRKGINVKTDANEVSQLIENSEMIDVEKSLNPLTLQRFTESEVIKQILQGAVISRLLKVIFILVIIIAVFSVLHLLIYSYQSGLFDKIGEIFK